MRGRQRCLRASCLLLSAAPRQLQRFSTAQVLHRPQHRTPFPANAGAALPAQSDPGLFRGAALSRLLGRQWRGCLRLLQQPQGRAALTGRGGAEAGAAGGGGSGSSTGWRRASGAGRQRWQCWGGGRRWGGGRASRPLLVSPRSGAPPRGGTAAAAVSGSQGTKGRRGAAVSATAARCSQGAFSACRRGGDGCGGHSSSSSSSSSRGAADCWHACRCHGRAAAAAAAAAQPLEAACGRGECAR